MKKLQGLNDRIDYNNLLYKYKSVEKLTLKISVIQQLFFKKKSQRNIEQKIKALKRGGCKSEEPKDVIQLFDDYTIIASKARHGGLKGKVLEILTPKQML